MDEKKRMVGGKLEVKVRVRNPIVAKQLEKVTEKWLVIDGFWEKQIRLMEHFCKKKFFPHEVNRHFKIALFLLNR